MTAYLKLGVSMLIVLALVAVTGGEGWAGGPLFLVKIDDLTDTVTVTVTPGFLSGPPAPSPTILSDSSGEFLHFTLPAESGSPFSVQVGNLFEDVLVGGTLSDRLLVTHAAGTSVLDVMFASDPRAITLPGGVIFPVSRVEDGTFQVLFFTDTGSPDFNTFEFQVRSDVASSERGDVPAPATLLLLGSGLAALAGAARRRRRK